MLISHEDVDYSLTLAQMPSCWFYSNVLKCFFPEFLYLEIVSRIGKKANMFFIKQQLVVILYKDTSRSSLALNSNSYPHNLVLSYFACFALIIFCKVSTWEEKCNCVMWRALPVWNTDERAYQLALIDGKRSGNSTNHMKILSEMF